MAVKKMNVHQAFSLVRFLKSNNLQETIYKVYDDFNNKTAEEKQKVDVDKLGYGLIFDIVSSLTTVKAEDELLTIFSKSFDCSLDEMKELDFYDLVEGMVECFDVQKFLGFMRSQGMLK